MSKVQVEVRIDAPRELVFDTIAHPENFQKAVPHIVGVEFLTETRRGAGTRFRETRRMGRGEGTTVLEIEEYVDGESVRLVSDQGGTIWDSRFETEALDSGETRLSLVMDARPYKLLARLSVPMIRRMIRKAVEDDLRAVKEYCEERRTSS